MARRTLKRHAGSFDVLEVAQLKAAYESACYYERHMLTAKPFGSYDDLITYAMALAPPAGLILEFGVATGKTIAHIAKAAGGRPVYGFDSFEGLPEDWIAGIGKGHFAGKIPDVPGNVELVKGYFDATVPTFAAEHSGRIAFAHIDCDLYSSTKTILDVMGDRIVPGTVLLFDEYWNYAGWRQHEHKAFKEFVARTGITYVGFVPSHQQVCVVID